MFKERVKEPINFIKKVFPLQFTMVQLIQRLYLDCFFFSINETINIQFLMASSRFKNWSLFCDFVDVFNQRDFEGKN